MLLNTPNDRLWLMVVWFALLALLPVTVNAALPWSQRLLELGSSTPPSWQVQLVLAADPIASAALQQLQACAETPPQHLWLPNDGAQAVAILRTFSHWPAQPFARYFRCWQVQWYDPVDANCVGADAKQRLSCALPLLPSQWQQQHVVFQPGQGLANARDAQWIYLPSQASIALLNHELAHWLGLADEYALRGALAQAFCGGHFRHPQLNVVVTSREFLSASELQQLWQQLPWQFAVNDWRQLAQLQADGRYRLGSEAGVIGLHPLPVCQQVGRFAWRPVDYFTAMQYHDTEVWPALYLQLIERYRSLP